MINNLLRIAPAVVCLLAINIGVFFINWFAESSNLNLAWEFGLFYFDSPNFAFYQLFTHLFMHGGGFHLFFNMFAMLMFGAQLEAIWGTRRFLIFYFITGLGAAFLHQLVQGIELYFLVDSFTPGSEANIGINDRFPPELEPIYLKYFVPIIGASGSIFGLLLAFAMMFPNAKLLLLFFPVPIKAKYAMPVLMAIELFLGVKQFSFDNIAHFAHLGGALFGFMLVKLWLPKRQAG